MAVSTVEGGWLVAFESGYTKRYRLRCVITTTETATKATVDIKSYIYSEASWGFGSSDPNDGMRLNASGSAINWTRNLLWGDRNQPAGLSLLHQSTKTFNLTSSQQTVSFEMALVPPRGGTSGTSQLTASIKLPAAGSVADSLPPAPSNPTVSLVSDNEARLNATLTATTAAPVHGWTVFRQVYGDSALTPLKVDSGLLLKASTPWSFTDTGIKPNGVYRWALRTRNSRGYSTTTYSPYYATSPTGSVSAINATRIAQTRVRFNWNLPGNTSNWAGLYYAVQYGNENAAWGTPVKLGVVSSVEVTSTVQQSALPMRIKVQGYTATGVTRYGPEAVGPWVMPPAAPAEPLGLSPTGIVLADAKQHTFSWTHNPVDGAPQHRAEFRIRRDSGPWTTVPVGTASQVQSSFDVAGNYQWQVRTATAVSDFGPWSSIAPVMAVSRPVAVITSPTQGSIYGGYRAVVDIEYSDPQNSPMSGYMATLYDEGGLEVENVEGLGAVSQIRFTSPLVTGKSYSVSVYVTNGYLAESMVTETGFSVSIVPPHVVPITTARWIGERGEVVLQTASDASAWTNLIPLSSNSTDEAQNWENRIAASDLPDGVTAWPQRISPVRITVAIETDGSREFSINLGAPAPYNVTAGDTLSLNLRLTKANLFNYATYVRFFDEAGGLISEHRSPDYTGINTVIQTVVVPTGARTATVHLWGFTNSITQIELWAFAEGYGTPTLRRQYGSVPPVSVGIERSVDGGSTWTKVGGQMPLGSIVYDREAPLNSTVYYRPVSMSATGVESVGAEVSVGTPSDMAWLSTDSDTLSLTYNQSYEASNSHDVELVHYLGDDKPTSHFGPKRPVSISVGAALLGIDDRARFERLLGQNIWYRDPLGRSFRAVIDNAVNLGNTGPYVTRVSLTIQEVEDERGLEGGTS